jgi:phage FluMu protein Com
MATKLEQEKDYAAYLYRLTLANTLLQSGEPREAIKEAINCLQTLETAVKYAKRYLKISSFQFSAHELIFRVSPCLFDTWALDQVEAHLDENPKLEKASTFPFREEVAKAKQQILNNCTLWDELPKRARNFQEEKVLSFWLGMGCVKLDRTIYVKTFQPEQRYQAKCPQCGALFSGKKISFCVQRQCPKCGEFNFFVLMTPSAP